MNIADPSDAFIIIISFSLIPSNDTSIPRCNAKIEAKASEKDMFLRVIIAGEALWREFIRFMVAKLIFVNA